MEQTPIPDQAEDRTPFRAILDRSAEPFAIFSGALLLLLALAQVAVLPMFNKFEVNGQVLRPRQLAQYRADLVQKVNDAESKRDDLVLPIHDETYRTLRDTKDNLPPLATARAAIEAAARVTQGSGSIVLLRYHAEGDAITVRGDVRAGVSSMTVLASFIEKVEALPFVSAFTRPAFTREEDPDLGAHSPFTFSFTAK